jgi:type IVB pilus formation R64 PilN family outer membrane protein
MKVIIMKKHSFLVSLLAPVLFSGCTGMQMQAENAVKTTAALDKATATLETARTQLRTAPATVERIEGAFVARQTTALQRDVKLPAALRRDVNTTAMFPKRILSLSEFAQAVTLATRIPTRIKADVYIDPAKLVAGTKAATTGGAAAGGGGGGGDTGVKSVPASAVTVELPANFTGPLPDLLDVVAARVSLNTRYTEDGYLEFYRLVTGRFQLHAPSGSIEYSTTAGQTGSAAGGNFAASSNLATKSTIDPGAKMIQMSKAMQSSTGSEPVFNELTGTLIVTDTAPVIAAVQSLVESQNKLFTQQVLFEVRTVRVTQNKAAETGVDLTALYQTLSGKYGIGFGGVPSGVGANAGGINLRILKDGSRWGGTEAFIKALEESGSSVTTRAHPMGTTNRVPAQYALTRSADVVSKTTATTGSGSAGVAFGIETKTESVGNILTVVPTVIDDRSLFVDLSISESAFDGEPTSFASGSGASQSNVQLVKKLSESFRERRTLRNGETMVLGGLEQSVDSEGRRGMDGRLPSAATGGSDKGSNQRTTSFILITARIYNN